MINIVIPMAGAGTRFSKEGFVNPKPLINVLGQSMIEIVIKNLAPKCAHRFIFICQTKHIAEFSLREKLNQYSPGCEIVEVTGLTDGAACTVLKAIDFINNKDHLMIANSDQYIDADINLYLDDIVKRNLDGSIMTMTASDPKWSFVELDSFGFISRVVEKEVISSHATVGIYNFRNGKDFVSAASLMISKNEKVHGEFYVAPSYNYLIARGFKFGIYNIGDDQGVGMHGLGTPNDLAMFLNRPQVRTWLK